jgi:hypothetical protein
LHRKAWFTILIFSEIYVGGAERGKRFTTEKIKRIITKDHEKKNGKKIPLY